MWRKDWILWIDKIVLKGDECLPVWLVFSSGQNSLLEIFLALYVLYVFGFYIWIQRKFFKAYFYRLKNVCSVQNSKHDILQVVGSHKANVIVRITVCFLWLPSWATRYNGLQDTATPQSLAFQNQTHHCHPVYLRFFWYCQLHSMVSATTELNGSSELLIHSFYLLVSKSSPCTLVMPRTPNFPFQLQCPWLWIWPPPSLFSLHHPFFPS